MGSLGGGYDTLVLLQYYRSMLPPGRGGGWEVWEGEVTLQYYRSMLPRGLSASDVTIPGEVERGVRGRRGGGGRRGMMKHEGFLTGECICVEGSHLSKYMIENFIETMAFYQASKL